MTASLPDIQVALQPKQRQLYNAIVDRRAGAPTVIGYGGSRGAAKSGGVRRIALALAYEAPCIIWIIRRVWDDLNKDHVKPLFLEYPDLKPFWRAQDRELQLPNGSSIFFIHSGDSGRAKRKARGPQAHYIFLEQAEEFAQEEMEALVGSNRAPGVAPGHCKRIYTFNPGGIGTNYLRRIFHLRQYHDNENAANFLFIQAYGWDNYEWFRGVPGIVDEWTFYHDPEWCEPEKFEYFNCEVVTSRRAFEAFITQTDFGAKLASLPQSQRIGELMGSFEKFAGQYYAEVWEESAIVLPAELVARIVQPWWKRWLATDWGFSHYAATGWFTSGLLGPADVLKYFGVETLTPVRIVILYREAVCNDVPEPELGKLIVSMTPDPERREVRHHFIGHDAWAKRGSANTVVEQMDPELTRGGLKRLSRADIDRVGGWRLMYNCWASARRLRNWPAGQPFVQHAEDQPAFFVSAACPEVIQAVPMLICEDDDPTDVRKVPGAIEDDVADMCFRGDMLVATEHGAMRIDSLSPGIRVWTRDGLRRIVYAWRTGNRRLVRAHFSNGTEVVCTPEHRFYTTKNGFVPIDLVRYGDKLIAWNQYTTAAGSTLSYQAAISEQESVFCTETSGRTRMGQFLRRVISTTATAIRKITRSTIWSAFRPASIIRNTQTEVCNRKTTWSEFGPLPLSGTDPTRGVNGTHSMPEIEHCFQRTSSVSTAESSSNPSRAIPNSAPTSARPSTAADPALMMFRRIARFAARVLCPTSTIARPPAGLSAVHLCGLETAGFADVYDIEVEDSHEFFVNGILVHNCRYGLKSYLTARTDTPDDVVAAETYQKYEDPTARAMAMLRLSVEQSKSQHLARRRRL